MRFLKDGMLDARTKALMDAIGLDVNNAGGGQQQQPEPEPEPLTAAAASVSKVAGLADGSSSSTLDAAAATAAAVPPAAVVEPAEASASELEQSCLAAVITAQQLADEMLKMTNRWLAAIDYQEQQ
jgi:hypothetical protein